ncbi:MAG: hypothetical protein PVG50_03260 [Thiohalophilus sp.]|jgi:hypothetical protein
MKQHSVKRALLLLAALSGLSIGLVQAQEQPIYGQQLMTEQERIEHRNKMRSFKTEQEREAYRRQHHEEMQQRAKARGVTLPDEPMPRGKGMGKGQGKGSGKGKGQGKGSGNGMGMGQGKGK